MAQDNRRLPPHLRGSRFNQINPPQENSQAQPNPLKDQQPSVTPVQQAAQQPVQQSLNNQPPNPNQRAAQDRPISSQTQQRVAPMPAEVKRPPQKIDIEIIPRPIIKSEESAFRQQQLQCKCFRFSTAPVPLYHPPPAHSHFITKDEGNVGPRFLRSSVYAIGNEPSILSQTEVPFGIVVQPLCEPSDFESDLPRVEFQNEPLRCTRCKAYVNPYFQFVESGNCYICNICKIKSNVPVDYYSPLGQGGVRADKFSRSELCKGAYEIQAPNDYIKKEIKNILILFCLELTQLSVKKGVYSQILATLATSLDSIPNPERTDIAFITFDNKLQFYNIPQNLAGEPQIVVVSELDEASVPLPPEKLFMNLQNDRDKIDYMIEKLQKFGDQYQQAKNQSVSVGTVLTNAYNLMAPRTGRIIYFGCSPSVCGIGKVVLRRVEQKILGTDNEKSYYQPQDQAYVKLGQMCQKSHIGVDLFIFNDENFELATVAPISNLTGGQIYFYQNYNSVINGTELHYALFRNLTRPCAYDAIMTVRCSNGIILYDYYTGSGKISVRDLELPSIDSDKSIAIMLKQEEKINELEAYIQYAILFTNQKGERVIRVFNLQLQVVNKNNGNNAWHNVFKTGDIDAISILLMRKHLPNIFVNPVRQVRMALFENLVNILHAYRKYCSSSSSAGQLILPEAIKILPLYVQALNKREIFKSSIVRLDKRIHELHLLMTHSFNFICNFLYPRLYPLHTIKTLVINETYQIGSYTELERMVLPTNIASTQEKVSSDGIYLLDNSQQLIVYVGQDASEALLSEIFNVQSFHDLANIETFPLLETDLNIRIQNVIEALQRFRGGSYLPVRVIRQHSNQGLQFNFLLFEDEQQLEKSYADYLCELHSSIQQKGV